MNKAACFKYARIIRTSVNFCFNGPLIPGEVKDNYLPTNFEKREKTITIFGATGFFGTYLIHELVKHKYQIIVPYRWEEKDSKWLKMIGTIGQNLFMPFTIHNEDSMRKAIEKSDIVINLIGRDFQNTYCSFNEIHVDFPGRLARMCHELGISRFVHMSALGASENPRVYLANSGAKYFKTKFLGEQEVKREYGTATIIRPSYIWGKTDNFIFYFLNPKRRLLSKHVKIPLWKFGKETVKQPVYAGDLAKAISLILLNDKYKGCTIEAVGPQRFQLDDLVIWFYLNIKYKLEEIEITDMTNRFLFFAKHTEKISYWMPHFTLDTLEKECITDKLSGDCITLDNLNIVQHKIEYKMQWLLKDFHCFGYSWDDIGGFPAPPNPPLAVA